MEASRATTATSNAMKRQPKRSACSLPIVLLMQHHGFRQCRHQLSKRKQELSCFKTSPKELPNSCHFNRQDRQLIRCVIVLVLHQKADQNCFDLITVKCRHTQCLGCSEFPSCFAHSSQLLSDFSWLIQRQFNFQCCKVIYRQFSVVIESNSSHGRY